MSTCRCFNERTTPPIAPSRVIAPITAFPSAAPDPSRPPWLFDRLQVPKNGSAGGGEGQTLLITGGGGGVGSILIQLARQLTKLRIVATASRAETRAWCLELGAHVVIDHSKPLAAELKAAGIGEVDMVASLTQTEQHYAQIIESLKPQGQLAVIDDMRSEERRVGKECA